MVLWVGCWLSYCTILYLRGLPLSKSLSVLSNLRLFILMTPLCKVVEFVYEMPRRSFFPTKASKIKVGTAAWGQKKQIITGFNLYEDFLHGGCMMPYSQKQPIQRN